MASQYAGDPARRKAAKSLMEKLRPLTDVECMGIVHDIRENYRLPQEGRTIGELLAQARQRIRFENGRLGDIEYTIHEKPVGEETEEVPPKRENPRQGKPGQGNPPQLNTDPLNTERSKTDGLNTHQSIHPAGRPDGMDRIELINAYCEIIHENVEYDFLVQRYGVQRMDETVELMLEVHEVREHQGLPTGGPV